MLDDRHIRELVDRALAEDLGHGDVTTACLQSDEQAARAAVVARSELVVAGLRVAELTFRALDPELLWRLDHHADGDRVAVGTVVARVEGTAAAILAAERTALNFMQRMCGVATETARAVAEVAGTGAVVLDTRKTAPGLRLIDKYAARIGGAHNHRFGLYDGILLKDNHLALAGGVAEAVRRARLHAPNHLLKIEVEVETAADAEVAVAAGADTILLDNMSVEQVRDAVRRVGGRATIEVSGGLRPGALRPMAEAGVDYLSLGWLTHSVRAADLALDVEIAGARRPETGR